MDQNPQTVDASAPAEQVTLKLISTKTHVGPRKDRRDKSVNDWSAAAKKIKLNNDLKVEATKTSKSSINEEGKTSSQSGTRSILITTKNGVTPAQAFVFMEAWDKTFEGKPGTPEYIARAVKLDAARSQVYASMGINPQKGVRPELSEEQRLAYSEAIRPYSFDYFEVRLSFKQPGRKAVRSKSFRYLSAPDLDSLKARLLRECNAFIDNWSVKSHVAN